MANWLHQFWKQTSGVSSVEFALIAPFMLILFLGMIELSDGLTAKRKVTSATSTAADLISRTKAVNTSDIADVYSATRAILEPYDTSEIIIRISSVIINLDGTSEIGWSDALNTPPLVTGDSYTLPSGIGLPGDSVIIAEVSYSHRNIIGNFLDSSKIYSDTFFVKPRKSLQIERL